MEIKAEDLHCEVELYCPNAPCIKCLRNFKCLSFLRYRKEHPEYDEKYTHYVATHSFELQEIEKQLKEQRSLLRAINRERVLVGGPDHIKVNDWCSADLRQFDTHKNSSRRQKGMKLDFSEVTELENKQAAIGEHTMVIKAASTKVSKNSTNMLVVDMNDEDGGFVRDQLCLEGPGAFRMKQFLEALGISEEDATNMEAGDFVGLSVQAEIIIEPYEGKDYSKVKKYIA